MGHDDDEHGTENTSGEPEVEPKQYWEAAMSRRARPQYDPAEIARQYLDDMERGGRLHLQRKRG